MILDSNSGACSGFGFNGYMCQGCGNWVTLGNAHQCPGKPQGSVNWAWTQTLIPPPYEEILALLKLVLERVAPDVDIDVVLSMKSEAIDEGMDEECFEEGVDHEVALPEQVVELLRDRLTRLKSGVVAERESIDKLLESYEQHKTWFEMRLTAIDEIAHTLRRAGIDPSTLGVEDAY